MNRCDRCPTPGEIPCWGPRGGLCDRADRLGPQIVETSRNLAARAAYPPLAARAASLARSLWDWAVGGLAMASDEEVARRKSICAACPRWDAAARKCILCGCRTDYKTAMRTEHCPEGRW